MDYNFNLKHSSQRRFKMSSFLQPSGLERCFSTSSSFNVNKSMDPFLNFISGFNSTKMNHTKCKPSSISPLQCGTLTAGMSVNTISPATFAGAAMSVSCFVGGLVPGDKIQQPQQYCDHILDVLLNQLTPQSRTPTESFKPNAMKTEFKSMEVPVIETTMPSPKRTYAEVAREKPKPRNPPNGCRLSSTLVNNTLKSVFPPLDSIKNLAKSCDNMAVVCNSQPVVLSSKKPEKPDNTQCIHPPPLISPNLPRQKSYSSSSDGSTGPEKCASRSLSECSVESDDSFIVFQYDGETACDDSSEEEDSSDDEEEGDTELNNVPDSPKEENFPAPKSLKDPKKKEVRWKEGDGLVRIHPLVRWDYASRAARVGPWEQFARDRERFKNRIRDASRIISPILEPSHRTAIFAKRFAAAP